MFVFVCVDVCVFFFVILLCFTFIQLVKQCNSMLEAGKTYCQNSKNFITGLKELGHHCVADNMLGVRPPEERVAVLGSIG